MRAVLSAAFLCSQVAESLGLTEEFLRKRKTHTDRTPHVGASPDLAGGQVDTASGQKRGSKVGEHWGASYCLFCGEFCALAPAPSWALLIGSSLPRPRRRGWSPRQKGPEGQLCPGMPWSLLRPTAEARGGTPCAPRCRVMVNARRGCAPWLTGQLFRVGCPRGRVPEQPSPPTPWPSVVIPVGLAVFAVSLGPLGNTAPWWGWYSQEGPGGWTRPIPGHPSGGRTAVSLGSNVI